jgi:hypothetical protein
MLIEMIFEGASVVTEAQPGRIQPLPQEEGDEVDTPGGEA